MSFGRYIHYQKIGQWATTQTSANRLLGQTVRIDNTSIHLLIRK